MDNQVVISGCPPEFSILRKLQFETTFRYQQVEWV